MSCTVGHGAGLNQNSIIVMEIELQTLRTELQIEEIYVVPLLYTWRKNLREQRSPCTSFSAMSYRMRTAKICETRCMSVFLLGDLELHRTVQIREMSPVCLSTSFVPIRLSWSQRGLGTRICSGKTAPAAAKTAACGNPANH